MSMKILFDSISSLIGNPILQVPTQEDITQIANKSLLIGETGAGKSTVINMLFNYFRGGSFQKLKVGIPTKFLGKTELDARSCETNHKKTTVSQTGSCCPYVFHGNEDEAFLFLDTPGLSDTRGPEHDDDHLAMINEAAENIQGVSSIILVINGTNARMTTNLANVLARMKGNIPDVLLENILVIFSNCDEGTMNFDLEHFSNVVCRPRRVFYMQNSAFSSDPSTWGPKKLKRLQADWEESFDTISELLEEVKQMTVVSTQAFTEMREARDQITDEIVALMNEIRNLQTVEDELEIAKQSLVKIEADRKEYSNYTKQKEVKTIQEVNTNRHNTLCINCSSSGVVCHEACRLQETTCTNNSALFSRCQVFSINKTSCSKCSCPPSSHYHARKNFKEVSITVDEVLFDTKAKYERAVTREQKMQTKISSFSADLRLIHQCLQVKEEQIHDLCKALKRICSGFNFVDELEAVVSTMKANAKMLTSLSVREEANKRIKEMEELVNRLSKLSISAESAMNFDASVSQTLAASAC